MISHNIVKVLGKGQRGRIYALMRGLDKPLSTMQIVWAANNTSDEKINKIRVEPVRRILQELDRRNLARKIDAEHWLAYPLNDQETQVII